VIPGIIGRACEALDVKSEAFADHTVRGQDEVDARACAAWVMRSLGCKWLEIAVALGYDEKGARRLVARVQGSARLTAQAKEILAGAQPQ